LNKSADNLKIF